MLFPIAADEAVVETNFVALWPLAAVLHVSGAVAPAGHAEGAPTAIRKVIGVVFFNHRRRRLPDLLDPSHSTRFFPRFPFVLDGTGTRFLRSCWCFVPSRASCTRTRPFFLSLGLHGSGCQHSFSVGSYGAARTLHRG